MGKYGRVKKRREVKSKEKKKNSEISLLKIKVKKLKGG